ncbi:PQQ-dependent sugar dehydrogenase [Pontibacter sp. G13]|uniref:PQQ-dependent sugar dehydrogenase n=1 Tax=Pontibacter sp. G13 TaxID=3074898 RepID=UPI00288A8FE9|nr:PQQ-dependent sugar dehydrogenase [Pontibacter sp. G13]WNJ20739.1 PQQ-dependent sugar dehydrogenase [Pontibacter sp. G13]
MKYATYLATLVLCVLAACTMEPTQTDSESTAQPVEDPRFAEAKENYKTYCSSCHGEQMYAFTDRKWKHGNELDSLIHSITEGYVDAGMPAWGAVLADSQIQLLAEYIRTGIEHVEQYGFKDIELESDTFETEALTFELDTVAAGLKNPWGMAVLPSGDLLVTDRVGKIYLASEGETKEIEGVPTVRAKGQGGMLDILLHPDFENNHWVYISYSDLEVKDGDTLTGTAVDRYTYQDGALTESVEIFRGKPYTDKRYHFGSRMVFDDAGFLYLTVGDRGNRDENPQSLANPMGKVHRLNDDGSIPADNPFVNDSTAIKSIWSYGHRNPQGLIWNPSTQELWEHEHGPRGGDELNLIKQGVNYGWPVISYGINYDGTIFTSELEKEGMEQPVHYWVPSIAPCGMALVTSDKYPAWDGNIMVGSLRFKYLNRVVIKNGQVVHEEPLMKNIGRVRNVIMGADGFLYVSVEQPGLVYRIKPLGSES